MKIGAVVKNFLNGLGSVLVDMRPPSYRIQYDCSPTEQIASDMNHVMGLLGAKASKVYSSVQTPEVAKKAATIEKR